VPNGHVRKDLVPIKRRIHGEEGGNEKERSQILRVIAKDVKKDRTTRNQV